MSPPSGDFVCLFRFCLALLRTPRTVLQQHRTACNAAVILNLTTRWQQVVDLGKRHRSAGQWESLQCVFVIYTQRHLPANKTYVVVYGAPWWREFFFTIFCYFKMFYMSLMYVISIIICLHTDIDYKKRVR